jgi:multisubunit Na+/H+ antiporter MnhC subunit
LVPTDPKSLPSSLALTAIVIELIASIFVALDFAFLRLSDAAASNSLRRASRLTKFSAVANTAFPLGIK